MKPDLLIHMIKRSYSYTLPLHILSRVFLKLSLLPASSKRLRIFIKGPFVIYQDSVYRVYREETFYPSL